ncbi:MAG: hypothetical protein IKP95_13210 [Ruminococcus sp.]|nr:hypothetical protein [Ruminococcus sp.]
MNKENKMLNIALRVMIFLTFIASIVSLGMLGKGLSNLKTDGLDTNNVGERMLDIIADIAGSVTFYYVVTAMTAVCLVLAIITRYKTRLVSYVFKIIFLALTLFGMIAGTEYIGAVRSCADAANLSFSGTDSASVAAALTSGGVSDAENIAKILTNKDEAASALGGYMLPIMVFFVLMITSIHCLVKRNDPNKAGSEE